MDASVIGGLTTIISSIMTSKRDSEGNSVVSMDKLIDLQNKIIEIQAEAITLLGDNRYLTEKIHNLEEELNRQEEVVRHTEPYITLKSDPLQIKYCATCFGKTGSFIQLNENNSNDGTAYCPECNYSYVVNTSKNELFYEELKHQKMIY